MPLLDNEWRLQVAVWALPILLIMLLVITLAPKSPEKQSEARAM